MVQNRKMNGTVHLFAHYSDSAVLPFSCPFQRVITILLLLTPLLGSLDFFLGITNGDIARRGSFVGCLLSQDRYLV